jgi:hypothetical protein
MSEALLSEAAMSHSVSTSSNDKKEKFENKLLDNEANCLAQSLQLSSNHQQSSGFKAYVSSARNMPPRIGLNESKANSKNNNEVNHKVNCEDITNKKSENAGENNDDDEYDEDDDCSYNIEDYYVNSDSENESLNLSLDNSSGKGENSEETHSLEIMCMSPPNSQRLAKKLKSKTTCKSKSANCKNHNNHYNHNNHCNKLKSKQKKHDLIHSNQFITQPNEEDTSSLMDSLSDSQNSKLNELHSFKDEYLITSLHQNSTYLTNSTTSAPSSAAIEEDSCVVKNKWTSNASNTLISSFSNPNLNQTRLNASTLRKPNLIDNSNVKNKSLQEEEANEEKRSKARLKPNTSVLANLSSIESLKTTKANAIASNPWSKANYQTREKSEINRYNKSLHSSLDMDPFDREKSYNKITVLLRLALSSHQNASNSQNNSSTTVLNSATSNAATVKQSKIESSQAPPPTPSSAISTYGSLYPPMYTSQHSYTASTQSGGTSGSSSNSTPTALLPATDPAHHSSSIGLSLPDESNMRKKELANIVWMQIYDFFAHYNDRASNQAAIEQRLEQARLFISSDIEDILASNFSSITTHMNNDIYKKMKSPCDYSRLYQHKDYIDQLCYLYWLVQDVLNRIGYVESLYPSTRILRECQPAYACSKFEGIHNTLMLWYKIMTDLMNKCDLLGRFLGFAKRPENIQYWTWFDQRLNYSMIEYQKVEKWLNDNLNPSNNGLLSVNQCNNSGPTSDNGFRSEQISGGSGGLYSLYSTSSVMFNSQVPEVTSNNTNPVFYQVMNQPNKQNRQVSFEIRASNSTSNLLYNNFDNLSPSTIMGCDAYDVNPSSYGLTANSTITSGCAERLESNASTETNYSERSSRNASTIIRNDSVMLTPLPDSAKLTPEAFAACLFSNRSTSGDENSSLENDHLKPAKLLHLHSYLSRSSSFRSNESPSNGFASVYNTLTESISHMNLNSTISGGGCGENSNNRVNFVLNDQSELEHTTPEDVTAGANLDKKPQDTESTTTVEQTEPELTRDSADDSSREKIFSEFLHKRLRKQGLTKTCEEIRKIILDTLPHALLALQIDRCERTKTHGGDDHFYYHLIPLHRKCREYINRFPSDEETLAYGVRSEWFKMLDLPTFRPLYLYLSNVLLELMHMSIKMQKENKRSMKQQSNYKFSLLSIEVLTHECRESIEQAILVRQFYYHMVFSVFERGECDVQTALENDLLKFDDDLKEIIDIYLCFITDWVHDLNACFDISKALWVLQDEWQFCKNNLYFVTASEDMYAKRFCTMCSSVIVSLLHNLSDLDSKYKQPLMEYISNMDFNYEDEKMSLPVEQQHQQQQEPIDDDKNNELGHEAGNTSDEYEASDDDEGDGHNDSNTSVYDRSSHRHRLSFDSTALDVNLKCNEFKEEVNQLRKRCMKALGFCANLISDLELAAKYTVLADIQELLNQLKASNHVLVTFTNPELQYSSYTPTPNSSTSSMAHEHASVSPSSSTTSAGAASTSVGNDQTPSFMIFVPHEFSKDRTQIVRLLFIITAKDDFEPCSCMLENNGRGTDNQKETHCEYNHQRSSTERQRNNSETSSNKPSSVRRLSSSNSFLDFNSEKQFSKYLNKLNKIANMNCHPTHMERINASGASSPINGGNNGTKQANLQAPLLQNQNAFILSPQLSSEGYLLYLQLPKVPILNAASRNSAAPLANQQELPWKWEGPIISLYASMPVRRSLYQHKNTCSDPNSKPNMILVVPRPSLLNLKRVEVKKKLGGTVSLIREKTSFHPNIEYAIDELKDSIFTLRKETADSIKQIEKDLKTTMNFSKESLYHAYAIEPRYLSEIWRVSYNFGIELQTECIKFMTQDRAEAFSLGLAEFCIMWSEYIIDKTERGKGRTGIHLYIFIYLFYLLFFGYIEFTFYYRALVRPWAAKKGLQLINEAWKYSNNLKDADFGRLISAVEKCILHVIGGRNRNGGQDGSNKLSLCEPLNMKHTHSMINTSRQPHESGLLDSQRLSEPQLNDLSEFHKARSRSHSRGFNRQVPPRKRFVEECLRLDEEREKNLSNKHYIGKILDQKRVQQVITATEVNFRWQLGLLIG